MAGAKDEANFRINVTGNAADETKKIASSATSAAKSIAKFEDEIKSCSADLRRLKGSSDEVKAAKEQLKAKVDTAKQAVSVLTKELVKQGVSYGEAAKAAKDYKAAVALGAKEAAAKLSGARADFSKAFERLISSSLGQRIAKVVGPAMAAIGTRITAARAAVAGALGRVFGPVRAVVGGAFAKVTGAIGKSFAGPLFSGIGKSISGLGSTLKPVASKLLPMVGSGLRLVGVAAVGAAAAIAGLVVAAAAGVAALVAFGLASADAAAKMQRQRRALWGTDQDAKNLGDQITALAAKVPQGTAELNDMALALSKLPLSGRATVSTLNAVAQVSGAVDAQAGSKIQELITRNARWGRMAIGRFELQGTGIDFDEVAKEYAKGTKKSVEAARQELLMGRVPIEQGADALQRVAEKKFAGLNLENAFSLENAPKKFMDLFRQLTAGIDLKPITEGLKYAFGQLQPNAPLGAAVKQFMGLLGNGFAKAAGQWIPALVEGLTWAMVGILKFATTIVETRNSIVNAWKKDGWVGIGKAVIDGLIDGIAGEIGLLIKAAKLMAKTVKDTFTGKDGIDSHSPSKVFAKYGAYTTEGYAEGVSKGSQRAASAVSGMAQSAKGGAADAGSAGGSIGNITVNISGGGSAAEMSTPAFLMQITEAVKMAAIARGVA